jgi:hypothetical protein
LDLVCIGQPSFCMGRNWNFGYTSQNSKTIAKESYETEAVH